MVIHTFFYHLLLPASLAGALAVLAGLLPAPLLKKLRWGGQSVVLAAPFLLFVLPVGPLAALFAAQPGPMAAPLAPVGQALGQAAETAASVPVRQLPTASVTGAPGAEPAALLLAALPWVWLAGLALACLWQWGRYRLFCRGLEKLAAPAVQAETALWAGLCSLTGAKPAALRRCPGLAGPILTGVWRPVLYLPAGLAGESLGLALRHEAAHLGRQDLWARAAVRFVCSLHWFNPLCAWQAARWRTACEYACDEQAAAGLNEAQRKEYGMLLLTAALPAALPQGAIGLGGPKKRMKARLQALLHPIQANRRTTALAALALAAALGLTACASAGFAVPADLPAPAPSTSGAPQPLAETDSRPESGSQPESAAVSQPAATPRPTDPPAQARQGFIWPVPEYEDVTRWMTSYHKGADLAAPRGSDVLAMAGGTVTMAQWHDN